MTILAYAIEGLIAALLTIIIFMVQGRITSYKEGLDTMARKLEEMRLVQDAHSISLARITEAQRSVVQSQNQLSGIHGKLVDDMEELEDASQQLQLSTSRLYDRMVEHDKFREAMERERGR
jgi:hypothetical protein